MARPQLLPLDRQGNIIQREAARLNRAEHVWFEVEVDGIIWWKCCLCGALASKPGEPEVLYHKLTDVERSYCPKKA